MRFARTMNRDIDAVSNAIEMRWSNGQAEGQINRLKSLKRAKYGRAAPIASSAPHKLRMTPFKGYATGCLKAFGDRIAARDPDRQTAEIHIRVALMNRFNALGTAEVVRAA